RHRKRRAAVLRHRPRRGSREPGRAGTGHGARARARGVGRRPRRLPGRRDRARHRRRLRAAHRLPARAVRTMSRERVLRAMAAESVDVLLLGREGNARYVSGAHRLFLAGERAFAPGCVVVRETGAVHLLSATDFGVPQELKHSHLYAPSWNPVTLIGRVAAVPGVASAAQVGVDGLTPLFEALLASALPRADLVDGESLMRAVRRVKSPEEVALI